MSSGLKNENLQVRLVFLREFSNLISDAVIHVHHCQSVMAFWGFSPSICQLFGASSWAHSDELQAQGCRFDQSSRALESVDDTWQLERRIADNDEGLRRFSRRNWEREADFRSYVWHPCVWSARVWCYVRLEEQDSWWVAMSWWVTVSCLHT